ncbi:MAG: hypothetical protein IKR92_05065, partial [Alphaproteobacteria bacterium]|nr:hypothetical protein [Alphaproteobacteria bacterium]
QDNELYDYLKKEKYKISAYKSRDIDMCRKHHKYNVSRCVEKVNRPINLRTHNVPLGKRTKVFAMEWLTSMHLFGDMSTVYKFLNKFINMNNIEAAHIDFNNLYVVDSFKTLDVVFDDIEKDSGKQAYFIFMDLPSNMYVYDEFCHLKDQTEWTNMVNMSWTRRDDKDEKQTAYMQQTLCLYGKIEQFMEKMRDEHLLNDTVLVIQGVSGVHNFKADSTHDNSIDKFMGDKSVVMAIYDNNIEDKSVDERLCSANQILAEYLFPNKKCVEHLDGYHINIAEGINKRLTNLTQTIKDATVDKFDQWYRNWKQGVAGGKVGSVVAPKSQNGNDFGIDDL